MGRLQGVPGILYSITQALPYACQLYSMEGGRLNYTMLTQCSCQLLVANSYQLHVCGRGIMAKCTSQSLLFRRVMYIFLLGSDVY